MLKKIVVMVLCTLLSVSGCNTAEINHDTKIDILQTYLDIRYSALTADNFSERLEIMSNYYSDDLRESNSWLVNPINQENTYNLLLQDGILTEILLKDIVLRPNDIYEANVIIKYNTKNIKNTYCVEYTFEVTFEGEKIASFEKVDAVIAFVGNGDVRIENGNVIVTAEPCDEEDCTHDHANEPS